VQVGIIGSGYAAKQRVAALKEDRRVEILGIAGQYREGVEALAASAGTVAFAHPEALLQHPRLELVFVCGVNRDHAHWVQAALEMGRHVVVEYPLALSLAEAQRLVAYACSRQRLLHVEHIELLSGVQVLLRQQVPKLGAIFAAEYRTITAYPIAPHRWTFQPHLFGFPLFAVVSRLHRLMDLWGPVESVFCQVRYQGPEMPERFRSCYCTAHLHFRSGIPATVVYGKGESFWRSQRTLDIQGSLGGLFMDDDQAVLVQGTEAQSLNSGSRLGLFALDTRMVIDHVIEHKPLYIQPETVLAGLAVAQAAQWSAERGEVVPVPDHAPPCSHNPSHHHPAESKIIQNKESPHTGETKGKTKGE